MVRAAFSLAARCAITGQLLFYRFGYPSVTRDVARASAPGRVDCLEGLDRQPQIDPVQGADHRCFRIRYHGATLAPPRLDVHQCFYFVLMGAGVNLTAARAEMMQWCAHLAQALRAGS